MSIAKTTTNTMSHLRIHHQKGRSSTKNQKMRQEINAEGKRGKSNAIKNWSPPPQELTKTMSRWGSIIVRNPAPRRMKMPELNRDRSARKPRKKQMNRTPRCPKIKRETDANKVTSARRRDSLKSQTVNHNSLPREATGSKRKGRSDHSPQSTA